MNAPEEILELVKTGQNDPLEAALNQAPELATATTGPGISLLQFAAYCRNPEAVRLLRQHRNGLDLFEAASLGDTDTLKKLLDDHPEHVRAFSADGFTALGLASFFGHPEAVTLLLQKKADPNVPSQNAFQVAPIHSACAISHLEIAALLLRHGADVNAKQMSGVTPLHSAAHNGHTGLIRLLIDHGADVNARMESGQTPLDMAEEKNFDEAAALLRAHL